MSQEHQRLVASYPQIFGGADAYILGLALGGRTKAQSAGPFQLLPEWSQSSFACACMPGQRVFAPAPDVETCRQQITVEACTTSATLLALHGCMSGGWAQLVCAGTAGDATALISVVRLFAIDSWPAARAGDTGPKDGVVYLSATVRHNLGLPRLHTDKLRATKLAVRAAAEPVFASEAVIARVASPHPSAAAASCRRQLSHFFAPGNTSVALQVGDIFGVPLAHQYVSGRAADEDAAGSEDEDEDDLEYARELEATLPTGMDALAYFTLVSAGSDEAAITVTHAATIPTFFQIDT